MCVSGIARPLVPTQLLSQIGIVLAIAFQRHGIGLYARLFCGFEYHLGAITASGRDGTASDRARWNRASSASSSACAEPHARAMSPADVRSAARSVARIAAVPPPRSPSSGPPPRSRSALPGCACATATRACATRAVASSRAATGAATGRRRPARARRLRPWTRTQCRLAARRRPRRDNLEVAAQRFVGAATAARRTAANVGRAVRGSPAGAGGGSGDAPASAAIRRAVMSRTVDTNSSATRATSGDRRHLGRPACRRPGRPACRRRRPARRRGSRGSGAAPRPPGSAVASGRPIPSPDFRRARTAAPPSATASLKFAARVRHRRRCPRRRRHRPRSRACPRARAMSSTALSHWAWLPWYTRRRFEQRVGQPRQIVRQCVRWPRTGAMSRTK